MIKRICVIGTGNVGGHLAKAFHSIDINVEAIFCRSLLKCKVLADEIDALAIDDLKDLPKKSDLYLLCVPDDVIIAVANTIRKIIPPNAIIAHTSGSTPSSVFSEFKNHGVFYPLQTFSKNRECIIKVVPFFITGSSSKNEKQLEHLARRLSDKTSIISDKERIKLHVAAVFVNNFSNYLFDIGAEILEKSNIPFEHLRPLIKETAEKVMENQPFDMQTGPAKRNDRKTIKKHLEILEDLTIERKVYKLLSKGIKRRYIDE